MSNWRPSLIAAAIVIFVGAFVGAFTREGSERPAETATQNAPTPSARSGTERSTNTPRKSEPAQSTAAGPLTGELACEEMGLGIGEIEIGRGRAFTGCALELDEYDEYRAEVDVRPGWTALRVTFASDRQAEAWPDLECRYTPDVGASKEFTIRVGDTVSTRFDLSRLRSKFTLYCSDGPDKIVFKPEIAAAGTN